MKQIICNSKKPNLSYPTVSSLFHVGIRLLDTDGLDLIFGAFMLAFLMSWKDKEPSKAAKLRKHLKF